MDSIVDYTSKLPEPILQHIMFFLSVEDAARTSILSKTWWNAWVLLPVFTFEFDENVFTGIVKVPFTISRTKKNLQKERHLFMKHVNEGMKILHQHKAKIEKFRLSMTLGGHKTASSLGRWIALATRNCVRELDLELGVTKNNVWHTLPCATFAAKSLVVLRLKGCKLEGTLFAGNAQFKSLRELSLVNVHLDEKIISSLSKMFPLLENFTIIKPSGLKYLRISNLPNLKNARVHQPEMQKFETIEIEAHNLQSFYYNASSTFLETGIFGALRFLKELTVVAAQVSDESFENLVSGLPLLECLSLNFCLKLKRVKVSSPLLRKLSLRIYTGLLEAKIDAPNLISYTYGGDKLPLHFQINAPSLKEANLRLISSPRPMDTSWFLSLREYLLKFNKHNDCSIEFGSDTKISFRLEELKEFSAPLFAVVKQLKVRIIAPFSSSSSSSSWGRHEMMLDGLFWCCHPDCITVHGRLSDSELVRLLLVGGSGVPGCCKSSSIRCWRHYLKGIKMDEVGPAVSSSLPTIKGSEVRFQLEWR